jgi:hypothetical protein
LFVLAPGTDSTTHVVMSVSKALDPSDLQKRINAVSRQAFVGIHRLGPTSYLIVFREGS